MIEVVHCYACNWRGDRDELEPDFGGKLVCCPDCGTAIDDEAEDSEERT